MDKKDAKQVLEIISSADGGCPFCVKDLLDVFVLKFPEHKNKTKAYYKKVTEEFKDMGVKNDK